MRVVTESKYPRDQLARVRIRGDEDAAGAVVGGMQLAVAAEVALDLPGDLARDPDLGGPDGLTELPLDAIGVGARVEVRRALEVVLGLGRVADLALDAGEPEDADRVTFVRAPDDVELATLKQQLVGIDPARTGLVALHRVVLEEDCLAAEDRGLDLRQPLRNLMTVGRAGDTQRDRPLDRRIERARPSPGESAVAPAAAVRRRRTCRRAGAARSTTPPAPGR